MNESSPYIQRIQSSLERIVQEFQPMSSQPKQLEPFRTHILALRAKQATYSNIKQILAEQGIQVSEAAISRFCRDHRTGISRHRLNLQNNVQPSTSSSTPIPSTHPEPEPERKFRSLRGPV